MAFMSSLYALVGTFNQEKVLLGGFSVIVKSSGTSSSTGKWLVSGGGGGGLTRHRSGLGAAAALQPAPVPCSTAAYVTLVLLQHVCSVWDHAPFAHCTAGVHPESVCLLTKFLGKMTACGNILCGRQNRGAQPRRRKMCRARAFLSPHDFKKSRRHCTARLLCLAQLV